MKKYIIFTILFASQLNCKTQIISNCLKCDIDQLSKIQNGYTEHDISLILCSYEQECNQNGEYSEYFNEIIFRFLTETPKLLINQIGKLSEQKKNLIYEILKNPINDSIDIKIILKRLYNLKLNGKNNVIKKKIINSLPKI